MKRPPLYHSTYHSCTNLETNLGYQEKMNGFIFFSLSSNSCNYVEFLILCTTKVAALQLIVIKKRGSNFFEMTNLICILFHFQTSVNYQETSSVELQFGLRTLPTNTKASTYIYTTQKLTHLFHLITISSSFLQDFHDKSSRPRSKVISAIALYQILESHYKVYID